jgi:tRNA threonylcarbamoyladenosine biosynthesis protein TsaE
MPEIEIVTESPESTESIGERLAALLKQGDIVGLSGELGAGKTVMVKGICKGLRYDGIVTSPTYSLINVYPGHPEIYHFDFYRLETLADLTDLGYEEYFYSERGISLVEWADRVPEAMFDAVVSIEMEIMSERSRRIRLIFRRKDLLIKASNMKS